MRPLILCFVVLALTADDSVAPTEVAAGNSIHCANLIYAGTRSSVCFSDRFLATVAQKSAIATARKFTAVKLSSEELFRFPFAVMTGEGAFELTPGERVNLKRYLECGGFLLASAGCSSREWDASFRRELAALLPERQLEPIPLAHEMFRTLFSISALKTKGADAKLEGLTLGDKLVVVYSADGLNDTHAMYGCCCCGGNEIANSQEVNANLLAYALVQ